ncbi:cullin family protein [Ophiostoma piceae UAMH 11346]|uniref:Anaphase-promoting complex subunit 2 n=1 Tax=Ophiostoma piceae (strain UAMH 11346) TaxID=1262450 RepID=S3C3W0_OPHP1|nr:cullin family protein [Ophiostoma piceae UAMH 11346]
MAAVQSSFATLDDALSAAIHHHQSRQGGHPAPQTVSDWNYQRKQAFSSVFQTEITQPTPNATPVAGFTGQGQPFGVPETATASDRSAVGAKASFLQSQESDDLELPDANDEGPHSSRAAPGQLSSSSDANDQFRFDRAWHTVTARISLPSSVAVEDSFGTLAPESQMLSSQDAATEADFNEAVRLIFHARTLLPKATHTEDVVFWHTQQVRHHYAQHVLPMLSACIGEAPSAPPRQGETTTLDDQRYYDHHMAVLVNSVRTLEAAFRLYFYGLMLLVRGINAANDPSLSGGETVNPSVSKPDNIVSRFRQDVNALVANSTPTDLTESIRVVFTRFASVILGFEPPRKLEDAGAASANSTPFRRRSAQGAPISPTPRQKRKIPTTSGAPPRPPSESDNRIQMLRKQMQEVLVPLHGVGLAGENFQILFAEIMDAKMIDFIQLSFAGRWGETNPKLHGDGSPAGGMAALKYRFRASRGQQAPSFCIGVVYDWVENHFARLAHEVLGSISPKPGGAVSFSDVKKWKEVALGRLSTLRMTELFDIVLHWPQSREGLEDLRVSVTTSQRRSQLVSTFSTEMQKRLLHPACSTLEIMQVYVAMIRTFHVLDPSNVLLSSAIGPLQFCLCQREDAVRIVVDGLLADPEASLAAHGTVADKIVKTRAASSVLPPAGAPTLSCKLDELATILNDPMQQRRRHVDEEELDWNDMEWMPDPIDAGTNYRRPKTEDVIGTLISALGSREAFTKEFQNIIAERLLSPQSSFAKEVKVLNLLKKRFGEGSMQNCEVMIKDIQDSNSLNVHIDSQMNAGQAAWGSSAPMDQGRVRNAEYEAKILSRLYWPGLEQDAFLLPRPIAEKQNLYASLYERAKEGRKLSWLNQLGQASVELELEDRTVSLECKTYEATVIYAFQGGEESTEDNRAPVQRSLWDLVEMLRMDEDLVTLALAFWEKEGVLRQDAHDAEKYSVVENLAAAAAATEAEADADAEAEEPSTSDAAASTAATAAGPTGTHKTRQARADDAQRIVYWQFIVGMLTNSAASMPLTQIAMMLKMLMAEGFPWSNEELQEFLSEKVEDGELDVVGGKYKLMKK